MQTEMSAKLLLVVEFRIGEVGQSVSVFCPQKKKKKRVDPLQYLACQLNYMKF